MCPMKEDGLLHITMSILLLALMGLYRETIVGQSYNWIKHKSFSVGLSQSYYLIPGQKKKKNFLSGFQVCVIYQRVLFSWNQQPSFS